MKGNLHHYTADTSDRVWVHIYLFIVATIAAYLLSIAKLDIPWWVETPSVFGFYGILFALFNNYLWKQRPFRYILQIKTPNLNGSYEGILKTSFDNFNTDKRINYTIKQTWSKIIIYSETDTSSSESLTSSFFLTENLNKSLVYQYQNTPKQHAPAGMEIHYGFSNLYFNDNKKITGDFFTGRGRSTYGTINMNRI